MIDVKTRWFALIAVGSVLMLTGSVTVINWNTQIAHKPFIDAMDYGCAGNGTTDDTTCLQTAWNAAVAAGSTLVIPAGSYKITTTLSQPALTGNKTSRIIGMGYSQSSPSYGTTILNAGTGAAFSITTDQNTTEGSTGISFEQLAIIGSSTSGDGIDCANCPGLRINHVYESTSGGLGLYCTNCWTAHVEDAAFRSNAKWGIEMTTANNSALTHVQADGNGNTASGNGGGIWIYGAEGFALRDSDIEGSGCCFSGATTPNLSAGVWLQSVNALEFSGNYCEQNLTACLYVDNGGPGSGVSTGLHIAANVFQDTGLVLEQSTNANISNNLFVAYNNSAISVTSVSNNAGNCQITVASPLPLTYDSMVYVSGISGATACNGYSQVTGSTSTTQFTINRSYSGSYSGSGTVLRVTGFRDDPLTSVPDNSIRASGNDVTTDSHVFWGNYQGSASAGAAPSGDLLPGWGADISSASTIVLDHYLHRVTGTTTVSTIVGPPYWSGTVCLLMTGSSTTTGGNIAAVTTWSSAYVPVCFTWNPIAGLWYPNR